MNYFRLTQFLLFASLDIFLNKYSVSDFSPFDIFSDFFDEIIKKIKIMKSYKAHSGNFLGSEEVANIASFIILANRTGALLVNRLSVL